MRRGLADSRERAQDAIADGRVLVGGAVADKAIRQVAPGDAILVKGDGPRYVSRGGEKLDAALDHFGVDPAGRRVLDAGASTGGFTDCVLQRGAASVVAVDVGYGQLHEKVLGDPRVRNVDRTNLRHLDVVELGDPFDLVVGDLSFISLRLVVAPLLAAARPGADLVLLVKPQFEAGRQVVSRGRGIVTDPEVWRQALLDVITAFVEQDAAIMGIMVSPITGADGNVEFLVHLRSPGSPRADGLAPDQLAAEVDRVVASVPRGAV